MLNAQEIAELIVKVIADWHAAYERGDASETIVTDEIRRIKPLNVHRNDLHMVVEELVITNTQMWHEEDKVRSENDEIVLKAIRNINPLNQHRNDLIEEIDEIILDQTQPKEGE